MFRAKFAHLQERKTEVFFTTYGIVSCCCGTICCKKPQSCAPEDGQKFARNMLSWSWRSIKPLVSILPYLHWWCTVKHKSSSDRVKG